jgi:curved DNA-binding protein CbpA
MIFQTEANFYEILEIRPDASTQDIRNAYLQLKASYRKDNPALYSVLDPGETDEMIRKIEEAFKFLSDPEARREYDERNGFSDRIERKIFSIDRSPPTSPSAPMEQGDEADILISPSTDFSDMGTRGESPPTGIPSYDLPTQAPRESGFLNTLPQPEKSRTASPAPEPSRSSGFIERRPPNSFTSSTTSATGTVTPSRAGLANPEIDSVTEEMMGDGEWRGPTLRKIREQRRYSLDDIASLTKISKNYLLAIEEEAFAKLPAPVFVRGFILQIARTLKIPPEPVAAAYLARFTKRPGGT